MSAIVGIVATHNTVPGLLHSLQQMEGPGHNSCGLVVHGLQGQTHSPPRLHRHRRAQRASAWIEKMAQSGKTDLNGLQGLVGMGHTGLQQTAEPLALQHAMPHISHGPDAHLNSPARVAVVVQGHIQDTTGLRDALTERGYTLKSNCGTELLAHLIDATYQTDPVQAVRRALGLCSGQFAVGVMLHDQADRLIAAQSGAELWLGVCEETIFVTSALTGMARSAERLIQLVDGDVVDIHLGQFSITDHEAQPVQRPAHKTSLQDWA
jgi:glucosamine--fructose-6-phosphate aminotransferase (isomerizing)